MNNILIIQLRVFRMLNIGLLVVICYLVFGTRDVLVYAQEVKQPNVAGAFYPDDPKQLSSMIDSFMEQAIAKEQPGEIFALISPHAGYGFSGQTAAYGYKLIKGKPYTTVIIIGPSHHYGFDRASVWPEGYFQTPLGRVEVDKEFTQKILYKDPLLVFD